MSIFLLTVTSSPYRLAGLLDRPPEQVRQDVLLAPCYDRTTDERIDTALTLHAGIHSQGWADWRDQALSARSGEAIAEAPLC
jgi:hypothetical protein